MPSSEKLGRYLQQTNYSSGLCMPEIAYLGAVERLDMLLNDAMYGILFRDINRSGRSAISISRAGSLRGPA
jgi:beta-lysine 5,6-aminomutase alpha subunit